MVTNNVGSIFLRKEVSLKGEILTWILSHCVFGTPTFLTVTPSEIYSTVVGVGICLMGVTLLSQIPFLLTKIDREGRSFAMFSSCHHIEIQYSTIGVG